MSKGLIGIAALHLAEPKTHRVVSPARWLYAQELSKLLLDLDYRVTWWQIGNGWKSEVVPGVPLIASLPGESQLETWPSAGNAFLEQGGHVDFAIYYDFILSYPQVHEKSIAIAHGVLWDDPLFESGLGSDEERDEWKRRTCMALHGPERVVAVDTSFIQWAGTTWPGFDHKFIYIPNFVPESSTKAPESTDSAEMRPSDTVRVLFPGPLRPEAGISETIRAMESLLGRYTCLEFHVAGLGSPGVVQFLTQWATQQPRTFFNPGPCNAAQFEMADIVLLPAKSQQDTALSCLQALAAGKAVIVGQVGGLTDLVLHEHNGIIVPSRTECLTSAVEALIASPELRTRLGHNASQVAKAFTLTQWRKRWKDLVQRTFHNRSESHVEIATQAHSHDASAK